MRAAIIVFPGSNRDADVARALTRSGAEVVKVWHADTALPAEVGVEFDEHYLGHREAQRAPDLARDPLRHQRLAPLPRAAGPGRQVACHLFQDQPAASAGARQETTAPTTANIR